MQLIVDKFEGDNFISDCVIWMFFAVIYEVFYEFFDVLMKIGFVDFSLYDDINE